MWLRGTCVVMLAAVAAVSPRACWAYLYDKQGHVLSEDLAQSDQVGWTVLDGASGAEFRGVGVLLSPGIGDCSGVRVAAAGGSPGKVYFLTAGHCALTDDGVRVDQAERRMRVRFNVLKDATPMEVRVSRVVYAILRTGDNEELADIALLELNADPEVLDDAGIRAREIARAVPAVGARIRSVGIPAAGAQGKAEFVPDGLARLSDCGGVPLVLDGSIRAHCNLLPGMSGSPAMTDNGQVVAVANHSFVPMWTAGGMTLNEVALLVHDGNLMADATALARCFDPDGAFDVTLKDCRLPGFASAWKIGRSERVARAKADCAPQGDREACFFIMGSNAEFIKDVGIDWTTAAKQACALGSALACRLAGAGPDGGRKSDDWLSAGSKALYRKGCELQNRRGCNWFFAVELNDLGLGSSIENADLTKYPATQLGETLRLLGRSCELVAEAVEPGESCRSIMRLYLAQSSVPERPEWPGWPGWKEQANRRSLNRAARLQCHQVAVQPGQADTRAACELAADELGKGTSKLSADELRKMWELK